MKVKLIIVNAFSINESGGNPAGIVLDAENLSSDQKQLIAKKAGLSETAFVSPSTVADFKLEFFTPTRQIAHCGHATIGTFSYLKKIGRIAKAYSSKETIDGVRKITFEESEAFMEQRSPIVSPLQNEKEIARSIGISDPVMAWAVNTGNVFIVIKVNNQKTLAELDPDDDLIAEISTSLNAIGFYVYSTEGLNEGLSATTRMFAPLYGIKEESATGMAAGPLGCILYMIEKIAQDKFHIEQGKFMTPPSKSLIKVNLNTENGAITNLFAGGDAYISSERTIEL